MNPVYDVATINGKLLGSGEPVKVKQGERNMMHILNSSPTEIHWISFSGHSFKVVAHAPDRVALRASCQVPTPALDPLSDEGRRASQNRVDLS